MSDGEFTLCPACGFDQGEPPWPDGHGSQEICVCCGLQFGYQDATADGNPRHPLYHGWRACWLTHGANWSSSSTPAPDGWDARQQVRELFERHIWDRPA